MANTAHWSVTVPGGKAVRCDDLPLDVWIAIAKDTGKHWHEILRGPLLDEAVALALYRACCTHAGVTDPPALSLREMIDAYDLVGDDLPTMFEDGIPSPKADEPATIG